MLSGSPDHRWPSQIQSDLHPVYRTQCLLHSEPILPYAHSAVPNLSLLPETRNPLLVKIARLGEGGRPLEMNSKLDPRPSRRTWRSCPACRCCTTHRDCPCSVQRRRHSGVPTGRRSSRRGGRSVPETQHRRGVASVVCLGTTACDRSHLAARRDHHTMPDTLCMHLGCPFNQDPK